MRAKAFVGKRGGTWFYQVHDSTGKTVLGDNTNNWRRIFDAALFDTAAVRRIEGAGHRLKHSYPALVEMAGATMNTVTESGARIMVQALVRSFVDATEVAESSQEWIVRARRLQDALGRVLGVTPNHYDIEELITSFEELDSVECGTHPDLAVNLTLTVNNAPAITEALLGRIERETTALLTNAGFGKRAVA
jgi:hypothetical protein